MSHDQYPARQEQAAVNPVREKMLHRDAENTAVITKPIYGIAYVEATTGIANYEYIGKVTIPTRIQPDNVETKSFWMFRTPNQQTAFPLEESGETSPGHALMHTMKINGPGSVTLIDDESLRYLMRLNGKNVTERSAEEANKEKDERRKHIHTAVINPGESVTVGRDATFSGVIGRAALSASRQHFTVTVEESQIRVTDNSTKGTEVSYIP